MSVKLICIGDSITKGTFTNVGENAPLSIAYPNFSQILKERLGADELVNYGTNNISYSATSPCASEIALVNTVKNMDRGDIIILAAGTNDYGTNVELGRLSDNEDISFYGAIDVVFKILRENNPLSKVYVILPIPRQNEEKNEKGYVLDDYRKALKEKADTYGFKVIDGRKIGINPKREKDRNEFMLDGVHPNVEGHKLYAEMIIEEIEGEL